VHVAHEGDLVLLISQDGKRYIIRLQAGSALQTHRGRVDHDELLGRPLGREVQSHLGYAFVILEPSTCDLISRLKRTTQIMFPKDIGYVLLRLCVMPGARVIEAGTGSGGLTLALARAVRPDGRVFSYEARPEAQALAQKNLAALGLADSVEFRLRDIELGFDQADVDALFLDVRQPGAYLAQAKAALKPSGFFGAIVPTTNQVSELVQALEMQRSFADIEVEELLLRAYKPVPDRLRPVDRMVAHTGYLVFARAIEVEVNQARYWVDRRRRKFTESQSARLRDAQLHDAQPQAEGLPSDLADKAQAEVGG